MADPHCDCLRLFCRLCGEERAISDDRQPIEKGQLTQQIQAFFHFDVNNDLPGIHPPFVCKLCELKMKKWWMKAKKKMKATCNIELAIFQEGVCKRCQGDEALSLTNRMVERLKMEGVRCGLIPWEGSERLHFMKMSSEGHPVVYFKIFSDLTWQLVVSDVVMKPGNPVISDVPAVFTSPDDVRKVFEKMQSLVVCVGNKDFPDLINITKSEDGQISTRVTMKDSFINNTIRHEKCQLMSSKSRCSVCQMYRSELMKFRTRQKAKAAWDISVSSTIPNRNMTVDQLRQKAHILQAERKSLKRKTSALQKKIATIITEESVSLDGAQDQNLRALISDDSFKLPDMFGKDSPAGLLWEQQKESAVKGKQMRWHPAIIRWCIALHSKSSSGYDLLRQTGFLRLPHPGTLHPYSHFADPTTGFNAALLERIVQDHSLESHEKNVSLLFDEMKVKAGLFFSVRSGKVIGFTDVSSIGNEVAQFEKRCRKDAESSIATHVLVLMVRGIFSSLHAPVGYYPSVGVTSDQLYLCIYEAVLFLETAGFIVRALVSDGASPNRTFYRYHTEDTATSLSYYTASPFNLTRRIFFICDVPHLIKTTRNNWENSEYHNKTKYLHLNKQSISWTHLLQLYEWDVGLERSCPGLRRLHKIRFEHLHLTPALRMRVYLATQVLSTTVANAFVSMGKAHTSSTVRFITMFDKFFDCMNVSRTQKGLHSRKPALEPYRSPDDSRFDWLMIDFLGFLREWDEEVESHKDLDKAEKKKMILSRETITGIKITVNAFVELGKLLLLLPDVKFLLSEKFNQDPLEQYFSKQRGAGGCSENPTVERFGHNMMALYVASSSAKASRRGNCKLRDEENESKLLDSTPLPRRK